MSSQIFKQNVPNEHFFSFIEKIKSNDDDTNMIVINNDSYKRSTLKNELKDFLDSILEFYHVSKRHYITRKMSYSKFTTIIRQICKQNQISYTSKIKYFRSTYEIIYYIVTPKLPTSK
jgi:DNA-directed RNA polymerase beta subunit